MESDSLPLAALFLWNLLSTEDSGSFTECGRLSACTIRPTLGSLWRAPGLRDKVGWAAGAHAWSPPLLPGGACSRPFLKGI